MYLYIYTELHTSYYNRGDGICTLNIFVENTIIRNFSLKCDVYRAYALLKNREANLLLKKNNNNKKLTDALKALV